MCVCVCVWVQGMRVWGGGVDETDHHNCRKVTTPALGAAVSLQVDLLRRYTEGSSVSSSVRSQAADNLNPVPRTGCQL